jgi:3,4-dihydroxy 2-butanone 4-phosphate synthase/GTP cyclohydrolase II
MRLMTNNPAKYTGLASFGLEIAERVPLISEPTPENVRYLTAKQEKLGHLLEIAESSVRSEPRAEVAGT